MRLFDIYVGDDWIRGIFADDLTQAKRLVSQLRSGNVRDYREYIMRNGEWVEVMV